MSSFSGTFVRIALVAGVLAGLSACGGTSISNSNIPATLAATSTSSDSAFLDDVFSVLDAAAPADTQTAAKPASKNARWQQLKTDHADLAAKFEAFKNLSPADRKAKIAEVSKNHPEAWGHGRPPMPHLNGQGPAGVRHPFGPAAFKAPNPESFKAFETMKDLKPEERKAKFEELQKAHPDWFPAGAPGQAGPGFGPRPGFGPGPGFDPAAFKAKNPELTTALEAMKDLKPEERKAKFEELRKAHPDWFPAPPSFAGRTPGRQPHPPASPAA